MTSLLHRLSAPITPGAKRAFLTLTVITLMLTSANLIFTARAVQGSKEDLCRAFASIVHKPSAPAGTALRLREDQSWAGWLKFRRTYGC
jgi:hypothetical protein